MSEKLVVVVGVTGVQGGSVARLYAREPGWKVRGITRDVSKPSNAALRELGIELVQADLDDPASLERAFEGANVVFAVTDFWQFIRDPSVLKEAEKTGKRLNEIACEREVQQGKNIIDVVSKLSPPLDRFILSTLSNSERVTSSKVKWNLHFDGKGRYTDYLKATYPDVAATTSYLYIGVYLDTWKNPLMRPVKKNDGNFALQLLRNQGDLPIPYFDAQNDTGHLVKALITSPQPTAVLGGSRFLSVGEFWRLWASIKNVNLVEEVVDRIGDERIPGWLQEEMADSKVSTQSYGWAGGDPDVKSPEEIGVEMGKLTDIERWIEGDMRGFCSPSSSRGTTFISGRFLRKVCCSLDTTARKGSLIWNIESRVSDHPKSRSIKFHPKAVKPQDKTSLIHSMDSSPNDPTSTAPKPVYLQVPSTPKPAPSSKHPTASELPPSSSSDLSS